MNKKTIFIFLLLLMFFPSTVYAVETGEVCVGNERYTITNYAQTGVFKYAGAVRKTEIEKSIFYGQAQFGKKYEGKILLTPEYYINGLIKIREENKEYYNKEEYKNSCIVNVDYGWNYVAYFGDKTKRNAINCKISKSTDDELKALAVDIANYDWQALKNRFGFNEAWNYFTSMYNIQHNGSPKYFSYNGRDNDYRFYYSIDTTDFRCRNKQNTDKRFSLGTTDGTFWVVGKYKFSSCPTSAEERANVSYDMEKVTVEWSFPQSKWIVTIPDLKGLSVKFIKKDHEGSEMDFVHLPFGAASTNYNYDVNETFCEAKRSGHNCNYSGSDSSRYKDVQTIVNNGLLTVKFSPNSGESIFYVGSYNVGGDCDGADLAWHQLSIPQVVENPYIDSNKAKAYCTNYIKNMEDSGYPVSFAYAMVPECNESTKMIETGSVVGIWTGNTGEANGFGGYTIVRQKMDNVVNEYKEKRINDLGVAGNTTCELNIDADGKTLRQRTREASASGNTALNTVTYTYTSLLYNDDSHVYWNAFCVEEITLGYLGPRALANAGEGFTYPIEVEQRRYCTPYQIKKPQSKPTCAYGIECYGGPAHHSGEGGAGPNEDFDKCVLSCDGGEYTQSCINMCYESVYGSTDTILELAWSSNKFTKAAADPLKGACDPRRVEDGGNIGAKLTFSRKIDDVTFNYTTKAPISSCDIITGNGARGNTKCDNYACISEHGVKYTYLNGCNSRSGTQGTACFEVFKSDTNCLPVNYGGNRSSESNRLIPDDIYNSTFKGICAQNDMNCYKQVSYAEAVSLAEAEYNEILNDIKVFKDNPASVSNYYTVGLNNSNKEFVFNNEHDINVLYKRYSDEAKGWTKVYDTTSLNMKLEDTNYSNYYKSEASAVEARAFGGNNGLYENINFALYGDLYKKYDFYNSYKDSNTKQVPQYSVERRYVFNLPNVKVDGSYTSESNYDYNKAYTYTMATKEGDTIYPNRFMSLRPDLDGLNALKIMTDNANNRWLSWRYFYNNGGVSALKNYALTLDGEDTAWTNIKFAYKLGTWNQVSAEENSDKYKDITCFYGIPSCEDSDCIQECSDGKCEETYIFRPVELKNMFPCNDGTCNGNTNEQGVAQRDPRFNWTDGAKTKYEKSYYTKENGFNYTVDPKITQEKIESKGDEIYSSDNVNEIDYDFTISRQQINAIRNYSVDGQKVNFGDYSAMECTKDEKTGMNVCYSKLLRDGNGKYITYSKLGTLGCNNQKNGEECE